MSPLRNDFQRQTAGLELAEPLIFFGTGFISLASLKTLHQRYVVEAVITKSDRQKNNKLQPTAVKAWAQEHGVRVFEADSGVGVEDIFQSERFNAQFGVVVDYGVLIPQNVIDFFPLGIINSHFSLLPKYRGPDPIRAPIVAGDDKTGVTLIKIVQELDAGPTVAQREHNIEPKITTKQLTQQLVELNSEMLTHELQEYVDGKRQADEQNHADATHTKKLSKQDGKIDWSETAEQIERKIRAYQPWPSTFCELSKKQVTLIDADILDSQPDTKQPSGKAYRHEQLLVVNCGHNTALSVTKLRVHGKGEMHAIDFINGYF